MGVCIMIVCLLEKLKTRRGFTALVMLLTLIAVAHLSRVTHAGAVQPKREVHALWTHPPAVGTTPEAVRKFVDQCKRAHIDTIVILIKGAQGEIYWQSKRFPQAIAKGYEK